MNKIIYVTGFICGALLFIWHTWQTVYVDIPRGGPIQIAVQALLISLFFGTAFWFYRETKSTGDELRDAAFELRKWGWFFAGLLVIQILWGGITSGLHGGHVYNTFPKLNNNWIPPELWVMEPFYTNFIENASTTQWLHRIFGTLMGVTAIIIWIRSFQLKTSFTTLKWVIALFSIVLAQYAVGVFTLIYHVPPALGLLHQILTIILSVIIVGLLQHLHQKQS